MLTSRVALIRDYIKAVEAGELTYNHDIIREAQALIARLPVLQADLFQPQFYNQCNDAALMTLMKIWIFRSSITLMETILFRMLMSIETLWNFIPTKNLLMNCK